MPNRWLKEAYLASARINAVAPPARDLWVRLVLVADDHGLFHRDPQLVASRCYPRKPDASKCEQLLAELEAANLITPYEVDGKPYLRIEQWYERPRSAPKYPVPSLPANSCAQLQADASNGEQVPANANPHDARARLTTTTTTTTTTTKEKKDAREGALSPEAQPPTGVSADTWTAWKALRGKKLTPLAEKMQRKHLAEWAAEGHDTNRIVESSIAGNWAGLHPPDKPARRGQASLAERRTATIDTITGRGGRGNGRIIEGTATGLDPALVPALPGDLREPAGDDVGDDGPRRIAGGMGD